MLEAVRLSLRLLDEVFDAEITDIIEGCKLDLKLAGIVNYEDDDPLILRAVTLYAKGHFGFNNTGEKFLQSYEALRNSLSLAGDYSA